MNEDEKFWKMVDSEYEEKGSMRLIVYIFISVLIVSLVVVVLIRMN